MGGPLSQMLSPTGRCQCCPWGLQPSNHIRCEDGGQGVGLAATALYRPSAFRRGVPDEALLSEACLCACVHVVLVCVCECVYV